MPRPAAKCQRCLNCQGYRKQKCLNPKTLSTSADEKIAQQTISVVPSERKRKAFEEVANVFQTSYRQNQISTHPFTRSKLQEKPQNNNPLGFHARLNTNSARINPNTPIETF